MILRGSKQFWRVTKTIKKSFNKIPPLKSNLDDTYLFTDEEKANEIANHFSNSHLLTINNISSMDLNVSQEINNLDFESSNTDRSTYVTPREIFAVLKRLKSGKASGFDGILNILLKNIPKKAVVLLLTFLMLV